MADLSKISIGLRTFLRDAKLFNAIRGIQSTMPEVQIVIADCGVHTEEKEGIYADLQREGHKAVVLEYDAGFGAMTNAITKSFDRDYLLIASDDFQFGPSFVRQGVEKMVEVLDTTNIDVAAGRVDEHGGYEFNIEILDRPDGGYTVIEHRVNPDLTQPYVRCDLTVNYCLYKRHVFSKVRWDQKPEVTHSIGGCEHGMHFFDLKQNGFKVAFVPNVFIHEQPGPDSVQYRILRARSNNPNRECCDLRNVKKYVLGSGHVDYERKS